MLFCDKTCFDCYTDTCHIVLYYCVILHCAFAVLRFQVIFILLYCVRLCALSCCAVWFHCAHSCCSRSFCLCSLMCVVMLYCVKLTVHVLEHVEDGQDLSVVWHQSFSHHLSWHHKVLQNLQCGTDHLPVPCVQSIWEREQQSGIFHHVLCLFAAFRVQWHYLYSEWLVILIFLSVLKF